MPIGPALILVLVFVLSAVIYDEYSCQSVCMTTYVGMANGWESNRIDIS